MENKINIAELLRDCPKGMELDCTMFENVTFVRVDMSRKHFPIEIAVGGIRSIYLSKEGCFHNITLSPESKCVIFPKGKTTWEGFVPPCKFKDGDVVVYESGFGAIAIFKQIHSLYEDPLADFYCGVTSKNRSFIIKTGEAQHCGKISSLRHATKEEKQILFDTIKERGYYWNPDTKTLEKLRMFKVGDRVRLKSKPNYVYTINSLTWDDNNKLAYRLLPDNDKHLRVISLITQDEYELVPNKFDINTLKPFDEVLMRYSNAREWTCTTFSHYSNNKFYGGGMCCDQCIPYKGNEHLRGKTDNCDEYFRIWED